MFINWSKMADASLKQLLFPAFLLPNNNNSLLTNCDGSFGRKITMEEHIDVVTSTDPCINTDDGIDMQDGTSLCDSETKTDSANHETVQGHGWKICGHGPNL